MDIAVLKLTKSLDMKDPANGYLLPYDEDADFPVGYAVGMGNNELQTCLESNIHSPI